MRIVTLPGLTALKDNARGVGLNPTHSKGRPMRSTQQFSITLPNEMADTVRAKVASGEYATESEVIRDGLRALLARDRAIETWLREEVVPAALALEADPSQALSAEQVRQRLAERRSARMASDRK
ncbi:MULTISPECIES: type II toxin-antitoxin system ParD family antitoxin [Stenotrophomonas]|uniref:ribbon-helix-helix domain-containing protein n=1 Tax=Stenotrophomonas TaxID=40323 RepID=UPI001FECE5CC|nr:MULTISPECIES: type II toxin-antitoxin system ParD family antitoxin [Stenotrophomonas]